MLGADFRALGAIAGAGRGAPPGAAGAPLGAGGAAAGSFCVAPAAAGAALAPPAGAGAGIFTVGAAVGFGGRLIRTVSFFGCTLDASPAFAGVCGVSSAIVLRN